VVIEVARLLKAVALIEADTPMARRLLAAWEGIDPDHPDAAAYARLLAELELSEVDCEEAVHSLLRDGQ
jgi:hypothetical protein